MAYGPIPKMARTLADRGALQNPPRAIVWSCDEFIAASQAFAELLDAPSDPSPERTGGDPARADALLRAGVPEPVHELLLWFEDRYRAHPARVAFLHFDRFSAIMTFLDEHRERLERMGLFEADGMWIHEHLLRALVSVDYRPRLAHGSGKSGITRCGEVLALTAALESGAVRVAEFERKVATGGEPGPESEAGPDSFELADFEEAMERWFELNQRPLAELRPSAERFRRHFGRELDEKLQDSPAIVLLLEWFSDRFGAAPGIGGLILRFMVMAGFIEEHFDRLVDLGLLEPNGERHRISGALFSTLNTLPLTPSPRGGAEPFSFDTVVALVRAHEELFGPDTILARETVPSRSTGPAQT